MKVIIEVEPYPEDTDEDDHTGLTEYAYGALMDLLGEMFDSITVRKG